MTQNWLNAVDFVIIKVRRLRWIKMMTKNKKDNKYMSEIVNIDEMIPKDHILRIIEDEFDFTFIYEYVEKLYSNFGRPSIDPAVLFKAHFLKAYYGIRSLRRTYEEIKYNVLYRWFLGYELNEVTPNYSTYSQNYKRKFKLLEEDLLETFFYRVLKLLEEKDALDLSEIYIDSTHTKANANKKKVTKQIVEIIANEYKEELEKEISNFKKEHSNKEEVILDKVNEEKCNTQKTVEKIVETKEILKSNIDPEAGILYKDEKEKMVAYNTTTICDKRNYILSYETNPSNMHDSKAFYPVYNKFKKCFGTERTMYMAGDAAYITTHICKTAVEDDIILCLPYKRPMTKKGYFKKYEYVYDGYNDIYICPNNCDLIPTGINKDGYISYKADSNDCATCPFKKQCTSIKSKIVTRHVWEKYKEIVMNDYRHDLDVQAVYKSRSEHIERIFADGKGKHGLRYTLFKGKRKVGSEIGLIFACMNLKKYATNIQRREKKALETVNINDIFTNIRVILCEIKNKANFTFVKLTLSSV